jgi:hypothetical protein
MYNKVITIDQEKCIHCKPSCIAEKVCYEINYGSSTKTLEKMTE